MPARQPPELDRRSSPPPADTVTIGPAPYAAWRNTALGAVTNALEQRLILELVGEAGGHRILDAGCGDGALACELAAIGAEVTGVDGDPAMLSVARERASSAGLDVTFVESRLERLPFPDGSFDVVVAVTVLCFVPDASAAVRELTRVLRPGGRLVIGELGRYSVWAAIRRIRGWLGSRTWRAARFRTASDLRALAGQAGLTVEAVRGSVFYPPVALTARAMAPLDRRLGRRRTAGAAFVALAASRRPR